MNDHRHSHGSPPSPYHENERTSERNGELSERVAKIESLLIEKGLVAKDALDRLVDLYEHDLGPMNGAQVVARAWVDADFKRRLLENATAAIAELGFGGLQGEHMVVVENTPQVHNVVVCTLCSCYPWPVLGLPPIWYKDAAYRSRVVIDPRSVLAEFGTTLADDVEVRVWDSSAEVRYLVLPERPAGTEHLSERELAELVDRDAMIGVSKVSASRVPAPNVSASKVPAPNVSASKVPAPNGSASKVPAPNASGSKASAPNVSGSKVSVP